MNKKCIHGKDPFICWECMQKVALDGVEQRKKECSNCSYCECKQDLEVFKLGEDKALKELKEYIKNTYAQHYAKSGRQTIESIMDRGHGEGFCIGSISKYADRYGFKNGKNRDDLLKIAHYAILALIDYDRKNGDTNVKKPDDVAIMLSEAEKMDIESI